LLRTAVWMFATPAAAQQLAFEDDFDCSEDDEIGAPAGRAGWMSLHPGDPWTSLGRGGVGPLIDDPVGEFGGPIDGYEDFLLTGHTLWADVSIGASLSSGDDDQLGLVARYSDTGHYYLCASTADLGVDCDGDGGTVGVGARLLRVDTDDPCVADFVVAEDPSFVPSAVAATSFTLSVITDPVTDITAVTCTLGDSVVLTYVEPSPADALPPGMAGVASFASGDGGPVVVDDVVVRTFDPDRDADGVPDAVELALGSDPDDADTDGDGVMDRVEVGMQGAPYDTDGDGTLDLAQSDADGDGVPDGVEAGTGVVRDTDCDGKPDHRDADSDEDGVADGLDNCRTVSNAAQADTDSDGVGDACDFPCGDGVFDPGEGCDDGNLVAGDGCDPTCVAEAGFVCEQFDDLDVTDVVEYGIPSLWSVGPEPYTARQVQDSEGGLFVTEFPASLAPITLEIEVETAIDDDFIGFSVGADIDDITDPGADYLLVTWKQATQQLFGGDALVGLAASRVRGLATTADLWLHANTVTELQRGATRGGVGWVDYTPYTFEITYSATRLQVSVDGVPELDVAGSFDPQGAFAFFNLSQQGARYTILDPVGASVCASLCGDGRIAATEHCDDGNGTSGDGCSTDCALEAAFLCLGEPSSCARDADGDGSSDRDELREGTDPNDPDTDGDGLSDADEMALFGTDPLDADTDDDGIADGLEATDPLLLDSEGDGIPDGVESGVTAPVAAGTSAGGVPFAGTDGAFQGDADPDSTTDPWVADTDGDGLTDGEEDEDGDGAVGATETDPNAADTDGDGLGDAEEAPVGTDALDPDTDDDGLLDGEEGEVYGTDPAVADTDGGGVSDGDEVDAGTDPIDPSDDFPEEDEEVVVAPGVHFGGCGGCDGGAPPGPVWVAPLLWLLLRRRDGARRGRSCVD